VHTLPIFDANGGGGDPYSQATAASGSRYSTNSATTGISVNSANIDHTHNYSGTTSGISANHTHTVSGTSGATGGGLAHENRPPYYALAYIMKS
jgi:microcystin-dependent protein